MTLPSFVDDPGPYLAAYGVGALVLSAVAAVAWGVIVDRNDRSDRVHEAVAIAVWPLSSVLLAAWVVLKSLVRVGRCLRELVDRS